MTTTKTTPEIKILDARVSDQSLSAVVSCDFSDHSEIESIDAKVEAQLEDQGFPLEVFNHISLSFEDSRPVLGV